MRALAIACSLVLLSFAPTSDAQTKRILWDMSHGTYSSYTPSSQYSQWAAMLSADNFEIVESTLGVLNENLSTYDVMIINVLSAVNTPYTSTEAAAMVGFAQSGGGILIIGDNTAVWPTHLKEVGAVFSMSIATQSVSPSDTYVVNLDYGEDHFDGISSVYFRAGGEIQVSAGATSIGSTANGETMIAKWDAGRVVAIGDGNGFANSYINTADNVPWIPQLFEFLAQGCATNLGPGTTGTGGLVPKLVSASGTCDGVLILQLQNALGGATALLLAGAQDAQIPAVGGTVYVDVLTPPFLVLPIPLGGVPGQAGAGFSILAQNLQAHLPVTLVFQFAVQDSQAYYGYALSNGLLLDMGAN